MGSMAALLWQTQLKAVCFFQTSGKYTVPSPGNIYIYFFISFHLCILSFSHLPLSTYSISLFIYILSIRSQLGGFSFAHL